MAHNIPDNLQVNLQDIRDFVDDPPGDEEDLQNVVEGFNTARLLGTIFRINSAISR